MTKSIDYNKLSQELDDLLARLESGELDVDQAVDAYERGTDILKELVTHLDHSEHRVHILHDKLGGQAG